MTPLVGGGVFLSEHNLSSVEMQQMDSTPARSPSYLRISTSLHGYVKFVVVLADATARLQFKCISLYFSLSLSLSLTLSSISNSLPLFQVDGPHRELAEEDDGSVSGGEKTAGFQPGSEQALAVHHTVSFDIDCMIID